MSEFNTTIENTYSLNTNAILSQSIKISQTKRTLSTAEFTCSAVHYIVGEMSDDLDFILYRGTSEEIKNILFYSQLNTQNKIISSEGSIEKKKFIENNFKFIIEDIGPDEGNFPLFFRFRSSNSRFNYDSATRQISYSTFITNPTMTGSLNVKNINSNIIPFFTRSLTLEWNSVDSKYVNSNPSNGYILSYSVDEGRSWFDSIITNINPINGKCNYSFNIEAIPNDSSIIFKVCCFNDLNVKSNEIRSDFFYKCDIKPVSNIKVNIFNEEGELDSLENSAKLINISYYPSSCSTKNNINYPNLNFWYSIIFPSDFIIYQGNQPINIYSFSSANITTVDIIIVDDISGIDSGSTELYILRDRLNEFLGQELIKNVNFIVQTKLINSENTAESSIVNSHSSFLVNLLGYDLIAPYELTINNNALSTVYKIINNNDYLLPDGENYIYLNWKKAVNVHNINETFLYDIYIGIDGVYTYENTTINNYYNYKMKKVDKKSILSFYVVARNKYASIRSEISPKQEVHFYDRPCLNSFTLNRHKNSCDVILSLDIETSIEELSLTNISLGINNDIENSITGLPTSNSVIRKKEIKCNISNLMSTSSYILTLNYTDNSGLSSLITEEFSIPSASPIMEVTPGCITMGGAEINDNYILNIKGNANIDGSFNIKPYEINSLIDDINSFKQSGNYICDFINASQITHMLPLSEPGSFTLVVVGGFVPIQFLIYTQYKGDNHIYMRNFFENVWSEWVLLHQKTL